MRRGSAARTDQPHDLIALFQTPPPTRGSSRERCRFDNEEWARISAPPGSHGRTLAFQVGSREVELPFTVEKDVLDGVNYTRLRFHARVTPIKAGALAHGLQTARGELIAILDADFVPSPDFLKRTVPHLVADSGLAFVQTRWGYLNPDYSALTRAQTIALDGHFVVEHLGRNQNGLPMNFNGTAGVWRRRAIESAGGWQADTLIEDVDLSFRAQLGGWRARYLPDVESPAELPPQMAAFKRQQARWATGQAQCLLKLTRSLLRGKLRESAISASDPHGARKANRPVSCAARLGGVLHLSVWLAHPMSLVLLLLTLPMVLGQIPMAFNLSIFWMVALGPIVAYALSQRHLYDDWKRRMMLMPVLALLGTGIALSNTVAIVTNPSFLSSATSIPPYWLRQR